MKAKTIQILVLLINWQESLMLNEVKYHLCNGRSKLGVHDVNKTYLFTVIQGWTLALALSPRRVEKLSGEYQSRITRPVWRVRFSYPEYY